ncbi:kinase-like domain-containing protein, partial [Chytriomyces sp. MP71]
MATPPRQETAAKTNNPFRTNQAQNQSLNQGSSPRVRATPAPAPNPFAQQPQSTAALSTSANLNTNGNAGGGADARKAAFQFQWEPAQPKQPVPDSPDAPLPPFHIGMSIDSDRIKLLDFVGQGSFAHVYLGYDYSTSSKCAVKCLMKAGADPKKMAMQKREVDAMRDLNGHPNVIKLIRTVENSEWLLIIMEFCQIGAFFSLITI